MLTVRKKYSGSTRAEFLDECEKGTYNEVVALYRSNESTSVRRLLAGLILPLLTITCHRSRAPLTLNSWKSFPPR